MLWRFLRLGCTAFGGPVAHLGYFREEFVRQARWLKESEYADLVALCQFLPGPTSSQVGIALGLQRAGLAGAFAAWVGFTLPSVVIILAFAYGLAAWGDVLTAGWIHGLKLAAVAVVANAVWSMAVQLCPDRERVLVALGTAALLLIMVDPLWQVAAMVLGGGIGYALFRGRIIPGAAGAVHPSRLRGCGWPWLAAFALLLVVLPAAASLFRTEGLELAAGFYRAGSLVFGGGHVILPLLDSFTVAPGWVDRETFLAGYGASQALPGPLFAFTAYLGSLLNVGPGGIVGGLFALTLAYVPSWLLVLGALPYWNRMRTMASVQAALMGTNAAVVGLLLAAFIHPVWTSSVTGPGPLALAALAFGALRFLGVPPWALVLACAGAGGLFLTP